MMIDHIRMLFDYTYWAHRQVWQVVLELTHDQFTHPVEYSIGSVHKQLVHTMSAEWVWLQRIQGQAPSLFDPTDYPTRDAIRAQWDEIEAAVRAYLARLTDEEMQRSVRVTTSRGDQYAHRVGEILLHVANHATDHRAQTLALLFGLGYDTPPQDLIFYLREQQR